MVKREREIDREVIAQLGQPVLRKRAREIEAKHIGSEEVQALVESMHEILKKAGGVGLAAPQVFESVRIFLAAVLPDGENPPLVETFINPKLTELSPRKESRWEGCLSFIELMVKVPRHHSLRVDYLDRNGNAKILELTGYAARVVQHEYDHLDGILTIDRAVSKSDIIKASEYDDVVDDDDE